MAIRIFRITLEVGDLERATEFYTRLLGTEGRPVGGGRIYFDCGPTTLALLKPEGTPTPIPEYLYFAVDDLEAFHARAKDLDALSKEAVHGESAAEIIVRPRRGAMVSASSTTRPSSPAADRSGRGRNDPTGRRRPRTRSSTAPDNPAWVGSRRRRMCERARSANQHRGSTRWRSTSAA
jgi:catechol 2,3-dioxygenase-like lactoylglutathione lyase family enzyme